MDKRSGDLLTHSFLLFITYGGTTGDNLATKHAVVFLDMSQRATLGLLAMNNSLKLPKTCAELFLCFPVKVKSSNANDCEINHNILH